MSKKGGYYCAFKNCRGLSRRDKRSFFRFPKDPQRSKQWVEACNRNDLMEKTPLELFNSYRVCAKHFTDSMFLNDLKNRLQPNSVPVRLDTHEDSDDSIDINKKADKFANHQDPIAKMLSNCILQKISADEFFKATGICIQEPISMVKATEDYLQNSNVTDHVYSNTKSNNNININDNSMDIDIDDANTNGFSIESLGYQNFLTSLPVSVINAPDNELSTLEINELSFMNSNKTVSVNKIPDAIFNEENTMTSMSNISNAVKVIEADTITFKDKLKGAYATSYLSKDKLEKFIQTEDCFLGNKSDETTQTEFYIKDKLDQTTQTAFSFLKCKLNKKKFKKVLQSKSDKIKELKYKIKQNFVDMMNNITYEQYELLTEKFFPK